MDDDDETWKSPTGFRLRPVHPGRTLAAEMKARDLTAKALALGLRVPANRLSDIVRGKRGISPETALRLGRYFGNGPALWLTLQVKYDVAIAERDLGATIEQEVQVA